MIQNYDPNIYWAAHTIEVDFMMWGFKASRTVSINGNCKGRTILESGIEEVIDQLVESEGLELVDPTTGDTTLMDCDYEDAVVAARIIKHEEKPRQPPTNED